jgi:hypothetical protein
MPVQISSSRAEKSESNLKEKLGNREPVIQRGQELLRGRLVGIFVPAPGIWLVFTLFCVMLATVSCLEQQTSPSSRVDVIEESPDTRVGTPASTVPTIQIQPTETELSFATIEQDDYAKGGVLYEREEPGLAVIDQAGEIHLVDSWISEDGLTELRLHDYDTGLAIAVFQGLQPSTKFGVTIYRITQQDNQVNIYAQFEEPDPDQEVETIITSPYHLVWVKAPDGRDGALIFNLVVGGAIVASVNNSET